VGLRDPYEKKDFRARPVFRILAIILSLPLIAMGTLAIVDRTAHSMKIGIPAVVFGVLFLIVGTRGFLVK
jgi:hypothetical protein